MKAFVTGGTGFIGSHLVDTLIADKKYGEIRCLVRSNEKWLKNKPYKRIKGDLHDLEVLQTAVKGVDVIFHIAGMVKAPNYHTLEYANVDATENLLRIAQKEGVPKMVIMSSLAAAGPSELQPLTEDMPMEPVSMYGKSKKQMEQMIHRSVNDEISVTILRPAAVYGPREDQIYAFFKMADKHISPMIGGRNQPRISLVYVDDVVQSCLKAAEHKSKGVKTYFVAGAEICTWNQIREVTSTVLGKKIIPLRLKPRWIKKIAAGIEKSASYFGIYPVINKEKANELILEWTCSIEKAKKELNYQPQYTIEEGIARTIHWYKIHHWL